MAIGVLLLPTCRLMLALIDARRDVYLDVGSKERRQMLVKSE